MCWLKFLGKKYRNLAELHEIFYTVARIQSLKEGRLQSGWARLALLSFVCVCIVCVCVCVCLRCPFRMPNKTKNGFHVCVSLLLGLLIIIITSVSLSFTVLLDIFFGGNWQHEPVTPEHKSTNWNGGSISIVWRRAVRPLRKLSRVQAEFSFFFS